MGKVIPSLLFDKVIFSHVDYTCCVMGIVFPCKVLTSGIMQIDCLLYIAIQTSEHVFSTKHKGYFCILGRVLHVGWAVTFMSFQKANLETTLSTNTVYFIDILCLYSL